jgi:hypothetical protein
MQQNIVKYWRILLFGLIYTLFAFKSISSTIDFWEIANERFNAYVMGVSLALGLIFSLLMINVSRFIGGITAIVIVICEIFGNVFYVYHNIHISNTMDSTLFLHWTEMMHWLIDLIISFETQAEYMKFMHVFTGWLFGCIIPMLQGLLFFGITKEQDRIFNINIQVEIDYPTVNEQIDEDTSKHETSPNSETTILDDENSVVTIIPFEESIQSELISVVEKDIIVENIVEKDIIVEDIVEKDIIVEDIVEKDIIVEDIVEKDIIVGNIVINEESDDEESDDEESEDGNIADLDVDNTDLLQKKKIQ